MVEEWKDENQRRIDELDAGINKCVRQVTRLSADKKELKAKLRKYESRRIEGCERCHGVNLNGLVLSKRNLCYMCRDILEIDKLQNDLAYMTRSRDYLNNKLTEKGTKTKLVILKEKVEKLTCLNASDGVSPAELWVKKKEILKLIEEMK